jgi:hypothetical protein
VRSSSPLPSRSWHADPRPAFRSFRIATVLLWTIIVLAIAIHFNGILTTNDLSECSTLGFGVDSAWNLTFTSPLARFIPFAIFVSAATIVLLLALSVPFHLRFASPSGFSTEFSRLLFGLKKANPITTRIELGCLGLDGILWLGENTTRPVSHVVID